MPNPGGQKRLAPQSVAWKLRLYPFDEVVHQPAATNHPDSTERCGLPIPQIHEVSRDWPGEPDINKASQHNPGHHQHHNEAEPVVCPKEHNDSQTSCYPEHTYYEPHPGVGIAQESIA